jgi:uncharacterized protein YeaO (DUF488 family)
MTVPHPLWQKAMTSVSRADEDRFLYRQAMIAVYDRLIIASKNDLKRSNRQDIVSGNGRMRVCEWEGPKMRDITIGRIWDTCAPPTFRVLVDRLWPRGVSKVDPPWDEWVKDVAPSTELRQWYGHAPERFPEFRERYWKELTTEVNPESLKRLVQWSETQPLMLLTATKDVEWSHLPVLRDFLRRLWT